MRSQMFKALCLILLMAVAVLKVQAFSGTMTSPEFLAKDPLILLFMENKGQILDQFGDPRPDILFVAHSRGMKVANTQTGISYQFEKVTAAIHNPGSDLLGKHSHESLPAPGDRNLPSGNAFDRKQSPAGGDFRGTPPLF